MESFALVVGIDRYELPEASLKGAVRDALELRARLLEMIRVEMQIAKGVNEFRRFKFTDLRDHQSKQRITGDVEGNA